MDIQDDITQDFITQAVTLSAQAIYHYYLKVLEISTEIDITDVEIVSNIQKLSNVAKSLVYAHSTLCDYAKLETVKAAIKTLNGIQEYFKDEQSNDITQELKQDCLDTLVSFLQHEAQDNQLELFDL